MFADIAVENLLHIRRGSEANPRQNMLRQAQFPEHYPDAHRQMKNLEGGAPSVHFDH